MKIEWIVFLTAMTPISELRGAIPLGIGLGLTPWKSTVIAIAGNLLIVPCLMMVLRPVFRYIKTIGRFSNWINRYEERAARKVKNYRKYRLLGLFLLVAVPLPTTGVYTGVVAANVLKIGFKNAWSAISLGVVAAGTIVYLISENMVHIF